MRSGILSGSGTCGFRSLFRLAVLLLCLQVPQAFAQQPQVSLTGRPVMVIRHNAELKEQTQIIAHLRPGELYFVEREQGHWLWIGRGWVSRNDVLPVKQAIDQFSQWLQQTKSAEMFVVRARALIAVGDLNNALRDAHNAVRYGGGANAFVVRGHCWLLGKEPHTAMKDLDEALRLDPAHAEALSLRGSAWLDLNDLDKAMADLNHSVQLDPQSFRVYVLRGLVWLAKKNQVQAIADCTESLRLHPRYVLAYLCRGDCWHLQGDLDKAIADYSEANRFDPDHLKGLCQRGILWREKHDWEKSLADFDQHLRLRPQDSIVFGLRGKTRQSKGDFDLAVADFTELIRREPKALGAYRERGRTQLMLGNYQAALADLNDALRLNPLDSQSLAQRASCRRALGDYSAAVKDADAAVELLPESSTNFSSRAITRFEIGWNQGALADIDEALLCNPKDFEAHVNAAWILATCTDPKFRDGQRALQAAETALQNPLAHRYWTAFDALAAAHAESGHWNDAVKYATRTLEMAPSIEKPKIQARIELYKNKQPYRHQAHQLDDDDAPAPGERQAGRSRVRV